MPNDSYQYQRANYRQLTARVEDSDRLRYLAEECGLTMVDLLGILSHADRDVLDMIRGMVSVKVGVRG